MSRHFSELIEAAIENVTGALASAKKGLLKFKTDGTKPDRPFIDDGTSYDQLMMEKHLPEARRDTKVQLDDAVNGNEVQGVLPYTKGGTGQSSLTGQAGNALVVNPTEDGFEFGSAGGGGANTNSYIYKELLTTTRTAGTSAQLTATGLISGNTYKVTVSAKCRRFIGDQGEIQEITFTGVPDAGFFTLRMLGTDSAYLAHDASLAEIQSAVDSLPTVNAGEFVVSGSFAEGFRFTGTGTAQDFSDIQVANSSLSFGGTGRITELQRIEVDDTISIGSFTINFDGQITAPIAAGYTATDIKNALDDLPNIEAVSTSFGFDINTGDSYINVDFDGPLYFNSNVPEMIVQTTDLQGFSYLATVDGSLYADDTLTISEGASGSFTSSFNYTFRGSEDFYYTVSNGSATISYPVSQDIVTIDRGTNTRVEINCRAFAAEGETIDFKFPDFSFSGTGLTVRYRLFKQDESIPPDSYMFNSSQTDSQVAAGYTVTNPVSSGYDAIDFTIDTGVQSGGNLLSMNAKTSGFGAGDGIIFTPVITTQREGVPATGETAVSSNNLTRVDGYTSTPQPIEESGIVLKDGNLEKLRATSLTQADVSENTFCSASETNIITMNGTTLTAEIVGVNDSQRIDFGSSVIIEDITSSDVSL